MPALPVAPQVLRIALQFQTTGDLVAGSRFYYSYSGGPPTAANCNSIGSGVEAAWSADLNQYMSNDYDLVKVTVTDLTSDTSADGVWSGSLNGTSSHPPPAIDAATLMNSVIARRYRGGKPRIYLPIGTIDHLTTSPVEWDPSYVTAVNSSWAAFNTALLALTGIGCTLTNHVNVSFYKGFASVQNPVTKRWQNIPTPRTGDAVVDDISSTSANPTVGVQRRRRFSTT